MRKRTAARELALQFLYQCDVLGDLERGGDGGSAPGGPGGGGLEAFLQEHERADAVRSYASQLAGGFLQNRREIDRKINGVAEHWTLSRMAVVDRNVLRIGAYELMFCEDIPPKVAINEAVDLAKKFGSAESGAFVNGLLDRIKGEVGGEPDGRPPCA